MGQGCRELALGVAGSSRLLAGQAPPHLPPPLAPLARPPQISPCSSISPHIHAIGNEVEFTLKGEKLMSGLQPMDTTVMLSKPIPPGAGGTQRRRVHPVPAVLASCSAMAPLQLPLCPLPGAASVGALNHRRSSTLSLVAGTISIYPQGMNHVQYNMGCDPAGAYACACAAASGNTRTSACPRPMTLLICSLPPQRRVVCVFQRCGAQRHHVNHQLLAQRGAQCYMYVVAYVVALLAAGGNGPPPGQPSQALPGPGAQRSQRC